MEDYEKLYKEAIHRASGFRTQECKDVAEYIFPELKESEDERIRRKLLALIEWSKSYAASSITADEAKEMIAWLEKQAEQKVAIDNTVWSKEDEEQFSFCCAAIELSNYSSDEHRNYAISFLESLKNRVQPQNTWKPSESDILLLERIANGNYNPQDFQASLSGLIGQLKNLKG